MRCLTFDRKMQMYDIFCICSGTVWVIWADKVIDWLSADTMMVSCSTLSVDHLINQSGWESQGCVCTSTYVCMCVLWGRSWAVSALWLSQQNRSVMHWITALQMAYKIFTGYLLGIGKKHKFVLRDLKINHTANTSSMTWHKQYMW